MYLDREAHNTCQLWHCPSHVLCGLQTLPLQGLLGAVVQQDLRLYLACIERTDWGVSPLSHSSRASHAPLNQGMLGTFCGLVPSPLWSSTEALQNVVLLNSSALGTGLLVNGLATIPNCSLDGVGVMGNRPPLVPVQSTPRRTPSSLMTAILPKMIPSVLFLRTLL